MNLTRDDAGKINELHSKASGTNHNYRDASNRTQLYVNLLSHMAAHSCVQTACSPDRWHKNPTLIQTPGKVSPVLLSVARGRRNDRGRYRDIRVRSAVE
jgi:hypothetical protein